MASGGLNQVVYRRTIGLATQFSPVEKPAEQLGLAIAQNVVLDREGIIETRRGFARYGQELTTGAVVLTEFQQTLLALDGNVLKRDTDGAGTWGSYAGTYDPPDASVRVRFAEDQSSLFFTTSRGIKKIDSLTGTVRQSGTDYGLDIIPTFTGTGDSWFFADGSVGYKAAFVRVDANLKETRGASSPRHILTNAVTADLAWTRVTTTATVTHTAHGYTTGDTIEVTNSSDVLAIDNGAKTITVLDPNTYTFVCLNAGAAAGTLTDGKNFDVSLDITIPDLVIAGDFLEVYRTEQSATAAIPIGDRYFRVIRQVLTAADITAGSVVIPDTFDESFLGVDLYENDTQETSDQANYQPPWARDLAVFKGTMHYAGTRQPEFRQIQLIEIAGLVDGTSSITVTSGATVLEYTFATAENVTLREFRRWTTEPTLAQNIEKTARSFCTVVNRDTGNSLVYARYVSGEEDEPGLILLTKRTVNTSLFTLIANDATTGAVFMPVLPTTGSTIASDRENFPHRLYYAKPEQPDSVPLNNWDAIGDPFVPILRFIPTKDSGFILKARGIWRKHGDTELDQVIDPLSPDTQIIAPEAAVALDNAVWCLSTEGVLKVSDLGVEIVSRPVEVDLLKILGYTNTETIAFAIAYHSSRKYILSLPVDSTDTLTSQQYTFNHLTSAWTVWMKDLQAGHVLTADDKLYVSHAVDKYVLKERKDFDTSLADYQDEAIPCTVTAFGTALDSDGNTVATVTVDYSYTEALDRGFLWAQGTAEGKVMSVVWNGGVSYTLTLNQDVPVALGDATLALPIPVKIRWNPEIAGSAASMKFYSSVQVFPEKNDARSVKLGFSTNIVPNVEYTSFITTPRSNGWGGPWGGAWGSGSAGAATPVKSHVPTQHKRAEGLSLLFTHSQAKERASVTQIAFQLRQVSDRSVRRPS